jgi:hypothetical protein
LTDFESEEFEFEVLEIEFQRLEDVLELLENEFEPLENVLEFLENELERFENELVRLEFELEESLRKWQRDGCSRLLGPWRRRSKKSEKFSRPFQKKRPLRTSSTISTFSSASNGDVATSRQDA